MGGEPGTRRGCAVPSPGAPVLSSNPRHLLCTHTSRATPPATKRMTATIASQEIQSIYGQAATALPG